MKKKFNLAKIISFVMLLTVTAMILVAGTYAKYSSEASGTDATVVAKWSFMVGQDDITTFGSDDRITFDLFNTIHDTATGEEETDVAAGLIAPGTKGAFEFALRNTSEVTVKYDIKLEVTKGAEVPLQFSVDGGQNWTNVADLSDLVATDVMGFGANKNVTIMWQWLFEGDTAATLGGKEIEVAASITATQVDKFISNYIDLSENKVALMSYYTSSTKKTLYSGSTISEITIYAEKAGNIHIGTAKISDVVAARTSGTELTTATNSYSVIAGQNTIALSLDVAEDETVVLGGNDSVPIAYTTNSFATNQQGVFTLINSESNNNILTNDKLNINVEAYVEQALFNDALDLLPANKISNANAGNKSETVNPFLYKNINPFAGKTITKIGIPVKSVSALDSNQTFTLYVLDSSATTVGTVNTANSTHTLNLPLEQLKNSSTTTTINNWIYVDVNITLENNETLAFTSMNDTVTIGYLANSGSAVSEYEFVCEPFNGTREINADTGTKHNIIFDIYVKVDVNSEEYISNFQGNNEETGNTTLSSVIGNKNLSILGDSISTYEGYSNDATNTNNTIGSNNVYYNGSKAGITDVSQTWWMRAVEATGMNLLVNNSHSGDLISNKGITRATQLHDNTGENSGTDPDIIAVYMGINDILNGSNESQFETNYQSMITNISSTYENAEIFVFTHVPYYYSSGAVSNPSNEKIEKFNNIIRTIAGKTENCNVVDLYADSGITSENFNTYMGDEGLHPNSSGMTKIYETFINALEAKYLNN